MEQFVRKALSPYEVYSRAGLGCAPGRHAPDIDARRCHPPARAQRPGAARRGVRHLPAAGPIAVALCRIGAVATLFDASLLRPIRCQEAVHHRHRRLRRRRQVDHGAHSEGDDVALAFVAEGRPRHDRRLSVSERGAARGRPDGEEGLPGKATIERRCSPSSPTSRPASPTSGRPSIPTSSTISCRTSEPSSTSRTF